jgi:UDP-3-O-[3-hydroxymyristoyl] glucosamine N-acyltransferase
MPFTVSQIAEKLRGEVHGDGSAELTGFAPADCAKPGDLTFAEKASYFAAAEESQATAILVTGEVTSSKKILIRVANPRVAVAKLLPSFYPPDNYEPGIHPSATIAPTAQIDPTASIGPSCVIGARARVGARACSWAAITLAATVKIGDDVSLFPNVVIYREVPDRPSRQHPCRHGHRLGRLRLCV